MKELNVWKFYRVNYCEWSQVISHLSPIFPLYSNKKVLYFTPKNCVEYKTCSLPLPPYFREIINNSFPPGHVFLQHSDVPKLLPYRSYFWLLLQCPAISVLKSPWNPNMYCFCYFFSFPQYFFYQVLSPLFYSLPAYTSYLLQSCHFKTHYG